MATIEQICELLKAHDEGKTIQCKSDRGVWFNINPYANTIDVLLIRELRVKPEPREVWIVRGNPQEYPHIFFTLQEAVEWERTHSSLEVIKFREVLDES